MDSTVQLNEPRHIYTDVLVIGGGGAGLRAAIEARKTGAEALVVAKSRVGYASNTSISSGGFAAVISRPGSQDSPDAHLRDTLLSGCFVNDQQLVDIVARGSGQQVQDLVDYGVVFIREGDDIRLFGSPGHSHSRGVRGEHSFGQDFTVPMRNHALKTGVQFAEGVWVSHLLQNGSAVVGAVGVSRQGEVLVFHGKSTILATGGAGQVYLNTDNAGGMTGDGYALAFNLGLSLSDMEFVQFYPTALGRSGRSLIIYEALVARLGATLRNSLGEDIRQRHGLQDRLTMTRDRMARAVFREIMEGRGQDGGIVMDLTTIPPDLMKTARAQLSPWIPVDRKSFIVAPTCHFFMGGLRTNGRGETGRPGLWAAGEVCAGVHGANRLATNAISEIFVFGAITGREAALRSARTPQADPADLKAALDDLKSLASGPGGEQERVLRESLKKSMWLRAGIIRDAEGLRDCLGEIASLRQAVHRVKAADTGDLLRTIELRNMLAVSEMVCRAALLRRESRGSHFRSDYPGQDDSNWLQNILITRHDSEMRLERRPVRLDRLAPS